MRILIAEDDFTSRCILVAMLKKLGHFAVETTNGLEAWDELQKDDAPKLVILDWMMPEMDGLEVIRRVRSLHLTQQPYIIMLTIKDGKTDIVSGLDAGANDYLPKPFDPAELCARIKVGQRMIEMQTSIIESRKILAYQASHDPLTGILNRQAILDRFKNEISRAERHDEPLAVGMCDIDNFKLVNDTYGHQTGDDVLREFAKTLSSCLRKYDSVGRIGGEEFLVITPMKSEINSTPIFDRLCAQISKNKISTRSGALPVTMSIGVAYATIGDTVDETMEAADKALYRAKDQGRNQVVYSTGKINGGS